MRSLLSNRKTYVALLLLFAIAWPFVVGQSAYYMGFFVTACIYSLSAVALNLLTGYGGQVSVGNGGFLTIGAYAVGILSYRFNVGIWLALPIAGIGAAAIGFVLGLPAARLRGHFLGIVTLGFGIAVPVVALNWESLTNGYNGIEVSRPALLSNDLEFFYFVIFLTAILLWMAINIARSRLGRAFIAVRDSEVAAMANGINVASYKTIMFTISAFFTGIAGGIYAYWVGFVSPNDYTLLTSFLLLAMIVVGGLASIWGAVAGAVLLTVLPSLTESYAGIGDTLIGAAVILIVLIRPAGIASLLRRKSGS
ncbi:MAG: branched-chain amino acid ABC transporter permease [Burkholderiaceae bacterium]|nr:MAG: branched-chain amino acid ABC transporter permease [Burkholderiaceae bacterium]